MTRARMPRPHEVAAARRDPRLLRAFRERHRDSAWRVRGACQSVDPETFFPAPSEPADAAVALCRTCPVQGACLAWALDVGDCHGVWGATTPRERRAMLVAWRGLTQRVSPPPAARDRDEDADLAPAEMGADLNSVEVAVDLSAAGTAADRSRPIASGRDDNETDAKMRERVMSLLSVGTA